jgi:16S rRNA (guanine(966)-N(2))-methyltransferase RsmD
MRVITGSAKGRRLITPKDNRIRPTSDRIKEALFSMIGGKVVNSYFLDGFAGTGNIGIEALSRGARKCYFVENHRESLSIIKENLTNTKLLDRSELVYKNFTNGIKQISSFHEKIDIIFLDPPYIKGFIQPALLAIVESYVLNTSGIIIIEHSKKDIIEEQDGLICYRQQKYGNTVLSFYEQEEI